MPPSRDLLERIQRLRGLFVDETRGADALGDYWRSAADVAAYDAVLGARIGWKWDAALGECRDRGWLRADDATVLDFGCGSGIAARRFVHWFGAREVILHDRSKMATEFAVEALRATNVRARGGRDVADAAPDVLLVSHVLGELDENGERALRRLIDRSRRVVIVEPGSKVVARRLASLRDSLLGEWHVVAPCPHAARCPTLAGSDDWCHFFAPPPQEVFTDGDWVHTLRALGLDARSLPYSFLALSREPVTSAPPPQRVLGRPRHGAHTTAVMVCEADGLRTVAVQKRTDAATWRALKKHPESVRSLPR